MATENNQKVVSINNVVSAADLFLTGMITQEELNEMVLQCQTKTVVDIELNEPIKNIGNFIELTTKFKNKEVTLNTYIEGLYQYKKIINEKKSDPQPGIPLSSDLVQLANDAKNGKITQEAFLSRMQIIRNNNVENITKSGGIIDPKYNDITFTQMFADMGKWMKDEISGEEFFNKAKTYMEPWMVADKSKEVAPGTVVGHVHDSTLEFIKENHNDSVKMKNEFNRLVQDTLNNGETNIADIVAMAKGMQTDEEAVQNSSVANAENPDNFSSRYAPNQETWTSGISTTTVSTLYNSGSNSQTIDYNLQSANSKSVSNSLKSKYSEADIIRMAQQLNSGKGGITIADVVSAAKATGSYSSNTMIDSSSIDARKNSSYTQSKNVSKITNSNTSKFVASEKNLRAGSNLYVKPVLERVKIFNYENSTFRNELYNRVESIIQNENQFPTHLGSGGTGYVAKPKDNDVSKVKYADKYDFFMNPKDDITATSKRNRLNVDRPSIYDESLVTNLRNFRASVGIPIHGNNRLARTMKYFMYNRYKVPDTNLNHSKTFTRVFFTRPDLNILTANKTSNTIASQLSNDNEALILFKTHPEIFKLLTDNVRCGDLDNFNLLLSNNCVGFSMKDEEIDSINVGRSWSDYAMPYGGSYTGRAGAEVTCSFEETYDLSIYTLIKLWITYIDKVARGEWSPSYKLYGNGGISKSDSSSHVFTRTLDYAASIYLFKIGPDGQEILYWSKYYGVFPTSTNSSAMSLSSENPMSAGSTKLDIPFRYAWKKDRDPMQLLEFNLNAGFGNGLITKNSIEAEDDYDKYMNGTTRPYVGTPFIEFDLAPDPIIPGNSLGVLSGKETKIRLKFRKADIYGDTLSDDALFKQVF